MQNISMQNKFTDKLPFYREPLLTTAAVAKWLGISTRAVCLWAECKVIPAIKIGRQWRFRQEEIGQWIESPDAAKVRISTNPKTTAAKF
jgi:excisionase family DNA binding protein